MLSSVRCTNHSNYGLLKHCLHFMFEATDGSEGYSRSCSRFVKREILWYKFQRDHCTSCWWGTYMYILVKLAFWSLNYWLLDIQCILVKLAFWSLNYLLLDIQCMLFVCSVYNSNEQTLLIVVLYKGHMWPNSVLYIWLVPLPQSSVWAVGTWATYIHFYMYFLWFHCHNN